MADTHVTITGNLTDDPDLRVPAHQRQKPSPLRTPRRPPALPRLPRGHLTCPS